ncbi:hypothetical protein POV26_01040 [Aequorivita todarodis]|uniref:hypothetical protein n=1 Tax=Aequorivita todarodis TaxID=2036821 RepID=UPI0023506EA7|nr:hypothetical protein [Aequorivita todarodis]MDC7999615.1 hypothetical protein [Aequorivita todarodis]
MKKQLLILLAFFAFQSGSAQIFDVFKNKSYKVSTTVSKENFDTDYLPSEVEIYHDKIELQNDQSEKIVSALKKMVTENLENAVSFFEIHAAAKKQLGTAHEISINIRGEQPRENPQPEFKNVSINLLSVVNNFAIYAVNYTFEAGNQSDSNAFKKLLTRHFYAANLNTGTVENIDIKPNAEQQKMLETLTISEFQKIYLLQTEKLKLNDAERIKSPIAIDTSFRKMIDYSEAVIFPYAAGVMIEFPAYSKSSKIVEGKAFRVLLKDTELQNLVEKFPKLKKYVTQHLLPAPKTTKEKMRDEHVDLKRFSRGPEELEVLKMFDFDKKIYEMKIENFQGINDEKKFSDAKIFRFNKDQTLHLIETRGAKGEIHSEEKFTYTNFQKVETATNLAYEKSLTLYYYKDEALSYSEKIQIDKQKNPYDSYLQTDMEITQHHLIFNDKYRYDLRFNIVGDLTDNLFSRHISENTVCDDQHCLIFDAKDRVVGIKVLRSGSIEILTDTDGKVLESYFDSDRHRYFFSYDAKNRIKEVKHLESGKLKDTTRYQYDQSETNPLCILKEKQYSTEHCYIFKFWD